MPRRPESTQIHHRLCSEVHLPGTVRPKIVSYRLFDHLCRCSRGLFERFPYRIFAARRCSSPFLCLSWAVDTNRQYSDQPGYLSLASKNRPIRMLRPLGGRYPPRPRLWRWCGAASTRQSPVAVSWRTWQICGPVLSCSSSTSYGHIAPPHADMPRTSD